MRYRASTSVMLSLLLASMFIISVPPVNALSTIRVGVAFDTGGPGDHSFDDAVVKGLAMAKKHFQFQVSATVTIGSDQDREMRLRALVTKGCNPIIAVGSAYAPALKRVALDFPSTQFVIVNDATISMLNVTSLVFSENQGGYLAGVTAALATKTGRIGLVGWKNSRYEKGFTAGAREVNRNITIDIRYGATVTLTNALITSGSDVIFLTTPGSDSEVLNAVVVANTRAIKSGAAKVGLIVIEPDQYVSLPEGARNYILASLVNRVDRGIVDVISESVSGRTVIDVLDSNMGIYGRRYGIADRGIELSLWSPLVSKYRKVINLAAIKAAKLLL